jgi:1-acyl-sn-glycerol-3-phosphate acyltransferase
MPNPLTNAITVLRSLAFAAAFYVATALFLVLGSPLLLGPRRWAMAGLRLHGLTCVWLLRIVAGTRLEVRGRENLPAGPCLVAAKHQSAWDTFGLIPLFRDPAVVLKAELALIPLYGWFCRKFEHIIVSRERAAVALKAMLSTSRERIAQGREIVIFPEGTRTPPGAPPDYKPGIVALYEALGQTCVPIALNSGLYWPRRSLLRYPGTIVVEFLEPIPPGLDRRTFRALVERRIEEASLRLIKEAARAPNPPPLPLSARNALADTLDNTKEEQEKNNN